MYRDEHPEILMIIDTAGIPLITQFISPNDADVEPILVSAFLSAIHAFSTEIKSKSGQDFININLGDQFLILYNFTNFKVGALVNSDTAAIHNYLIKIGNEFKIIIDTEEEIFQIDEGISRLFKNTIIRLLSNDRVSPKWVPELLVSSAKSFFQIQHDIVNIIDGKNSVVKIARLSNIQLSEVKYILYGLWINSFINFTKPLDRKLLLVQTEKSRRFILSDNKYCEQYQVSTDHQSSFLCQQNDSIDCKSMLKRIKGPTEINSLLSDEPTDIEIINCLKYHGLLKSLSRLHNQLIQIKKITSNIINSMNSKIKRKETNSIISNSKVILDEIGASNDVLIMDNEIKIDDAIDNYTSFSDDELSKVINVWVDFNLDIINNIPNTKKKKVIEILMENYSDSLIDFYQDEFDTRFENYDGLLHMLEALLAWN